MSEPFLGMFFLVADQYKRGASQFSDVNIHLPMRRGELKIKTALADLISHTKKYGTTV